jgi:hypothetical protein
MVREMHTCQSFRAQIVTACSYRMASVISIGFELTQLHTSLPILLIPVRVTWRVLFLLRLLLLLLAAVEKLIEELKLSSTRSDEKPEKSQEDPHDA